MHVTAIILAGGRGSRMKSDIPKQYIEIGGKTLLYYTIRSFALSNIDDMVIVCGSGDEELVSTIASSAVNGKTFTVTAGGKERYDSVYNGLLACDTADFVLIHDGARCCISTELINTIISNRKNSIVAVPVKDTIKRVDNNGKVVDTPARNELYAVQTPQAFYYKDIKEAHDLFRRSLADGEEISKGVTDDSMVMERFSDKEIYVIEGEDTNFKVTTPADLEIAKSILLG